MNSNLSILNSTLQLHRSCTGWQSCGNAFKGLRPGFHNFDQLSISGGRVSLYRIDAKPGQDTEKMEEFNEGRVPFT